MLSTGTVTMSLADIDALRDEIKNQKSTIKDLEQELTQVKADKRIVKLTKTEYLPAPIKLEMRALSTEILHYIARSRYSATPGGSLQYEIENLINNHIHRVKVMWPAASEESKEKTEYVNFEDVQEELRKEAENRMSAELAKLRHQVNTQTQKLTALEEKHKDEMIAFQTKQTKEANAYLEEIESWKKKYEDLLHERDTRTHQEKLEAEIKELKEQLEKERNKSWFKKLAG